MTARTHPHAGLVEACRPHRRRLSAALASAILVAAVTHLLPTAQAAPAARSSATSAPKLHAAVSLSATSVWVGQKVTADVRRSTVPRGDHVAKVVYRWGDGSTTTAKALGTSSHAYRAAKAYRVTVQVTDARHHTVSAAATVTVGRARPAAGSYTAVNAEYTAYRLLLYVAPDRIHLQDVSLDLSGLACAPGGQNFYDHLMVGSIPLAPGGSFSSTTTQTGAFAGHAATFTYVVAGHVLPPAHGVQTITGTWKETVKTTDGTGWTCTSNTWPWTASRDVQPTQPGGRPPAGAYTAVNAQHTAYRLRFDVGPDSSSLTDVSLDLASLTCLPDGGSLTDHLVLADVPIAADGTVDVTRTDTGVIGGKAVTFTYALVGRTHGVDPHGAARMAGSWREDIAFDDDSGRTCTTDAWPWTATRTP